MWRCVRYNLAIWWMMNNFKHTYAVIMAGGGGTRLWPVSRKERPKQLLPLLDDKTLFQSTVKRLENFFPPERILVVTVTEQASEMQKQAPEIPLENYLIEPAPRGTASVVGLAAAVLRKRDPDAMMSVLPSDHFIRNRDLFHYLMREAFQVAEKGYLVTLGITPTYPSTGYGYIQQGEALDGEFKYPVYTVKRFIEKPNEETAQQLLRMGDHSWNSGMFIWKTETILGEFARQMPALHKQLTKIEKALGTENAAAVLEKVWEKVEKETIDYGIMEHAREVAVIPAQFEWNDIGSWKTLMEILQADEMGNVLIGEHLALDTQNTLVYSPNKLVATVGLENMVIVETDDALLICPQDRAQDVRDIVNALREKRSDLL